METMETTAREADVSDLADARDDAGKADRRSALKLMRKRARDVASRAQDLSLRAQDFAARAPRRARSGIVRRRSAAADRLNGLAEAVRPREETRARIRRNTAVAAGGSTLALAAALGAGVALGFMLSRELKKREAARLDAGPEQPRARPRTAPPEPSVVVGATGLPH